METKVADRFQDIRDKALRKIADGRKEYRKQKQKYDNEIAKAQQNWRMRKHHYRMDSRN